jgi:hypothetical protein
VTLVEKQDYSLLRAENERLLSDVEKLKQRLREEISKTSAGVRLDLNLEKGRMRDELSARELKIREVETRIEVCFKRWLSGGLTYACYQTEISQLRATMESVKFNVMQCQFYASSSLVNLTGLYRHCRYFDGFRSSLAWCVPVISIVNEMLR